MRTSTASTLVHDLATWFPIATYTLTAPVTDFEIPIPTGVPKRFYRFRFVP